MPRELSASSRRVSDATLVHPPWRGSRPSFQGVRRPLCRTIGVAAGTRVRDLELIGQPWRDEPERVTPNVHVCNGLLDSWHVTRHTLTTGAPALMMRVILDCRRMRTVRRGGAV